MNQNFNGKVCDINECHSEEVVLEFAKKKKPGKKKRINLVEVFVRKQAPI